MTRVPPPRYRVIERGRRLVVVDNWADGGRPEPVAPPWEKRKSRSLQAPATGHKATQPHRGQAPNPFGAVRRTSYDGRGELRTHPFYDARGPRTIRLDPGSASLTEAGKHAAGLAIIAIVIAMIVSPWMLLVIPVFAYQLRNRIRDRITAWLDTVAREGS